MLKKKLMNSIKDDEQIENQSTENTTKIIKDDEIINFMAYQDEIQRKRSIRRNRFFLIIFSTIIYILGIGLFSNITINVYEMNQNVGLVLGIVLLIAYTMLFIFVLVDIFSKHAFDLDFKDKKNRRKREQKNNKVRFEIAYNLIEQNATVESLYKPNSDGISLRNLEEILSKIKHDSIPSYKKEESKEVAETLLNLFKKNGQIHKTAKRMIFKESVSVGCLTAISQDKFVDSGIVVMKNLQLIKNIIWLYGFRPTTEEMNRIVIKILRNVCVSFGLNTMPSATNVASKIFNKDSSNAIVQLVGSVVDMGAQLVGNAVLTYLLGKYTINVLLREFRVQEILRAQSLSIDELEIEITDNTINEIKNSIKDSTKNNE